MSRMTLLLAALLLAGGLFAQDVQGKPAERLGNEAANSADSLYQKGDSIAQSDPAQAKQFYSQAAANYQDAYNFYITARDKDGAVVADKLARMQKNMGICYGRAGDFQNYARLALRQWKADPTDIAVAKNLAVAYNKIEKPDSAVYVLTQTDQVKPSPDVERLIGQLRLTQAQKIDTDQNKPLVPEAVPLYNEALTWFQKYVSLRSDADMIARIAAIQIRLGNNQGAIDAYNQYLATNPGDIQKTNTYKSMGKMYEDLKDMPKAAECYFNSFSITYNQQIGQKLIQIYDDQKNTAQMKICIDAILKNNPGDAMATYYDADLKYRAGNKTAARAEFQTIINDHTFGQYAQDYIKKIDGEK